PAPGSVADAEVGVAIILVVIAARIILATVPRDSQADAPFVVAAAIDIVDADHVEAAPLGLLAAGVARLVRSSGDRPAGGLAGGEQRRGGERGHDHRARAAAGSDGGGAMAAHDILLAAIAAGGPREA